MWLDEINLKIREKESFYDEIERKLLDLSNSKGKLEKDSQDKETIDIPENINSEKFKMEELKEKYATELDGDNFEIRFKELLSNSKPDNISSKFLGLLKKTEEEATVLKNELIEVRQGYNLKYNLSYPTTLDNNNEYSSELDKITNVELPKYENEIEDSKEKSYNQFREEFLSKLKANIDEVKSQITELNRALSQYKFGADKYSFKVSPKEEYKRFYDMITDPILLDGYSLTTELFNQKYALEIKELFERITNIDNEISDEEYYKNVAEYTDYKNYLKFDLIVKDNSGNEQRLSKTLAKKSGGETQTPFYISILASFAQVYRLKNDDNTLRLIVFDEAFSKMDSERIEESIKLLRKMGFQTIFAAPPEKLQDVFEFVDNTLCVLNPKENSIIVRKFNKKADLFNGI